MCVKPELVENVWTKPQYMEFIVEGNEFDKYTDMWYARLEKYYSQFV
jgi:hypothetical protein